MLIHRSMSPTICGEAQPSVCRHGRDEDRVFRAIRRRSVCGFRIAVTDHVFADDCEPLVVARKEVRFKWTDLTTVQIDLYLEPAGTETSAPHAVG